MIRKILLLAIVGTVLVVCFAWPHLNEVETGRTPEYPELKVRDYGASPDQIARAVDAALSRLPRWRAAGSGKGPMGAEIAAVHWTFFGVEEDVAVKVRREAGRTKVSVRSRSRSWPWDFGQNARNVRELQSAIDRGLR